MNDYIKFTLSIGILYLIIKLILTKKENKEEENKIIIKPVKQNKIQEIKRKEHNENIKKFIEKEKEERKIIFEKNRKERAKKIYKENVKKGKDYEKYISEYYKKQGYKVKEHGLENGRKDQGIDIIIMKDKTITLIQCKNWKADSKRKINHTKIKEFLGNCATFIEKNQEKLKQEYKIKKLFIVSNDILDNSAKKYLKNNNEIVEYKIIPYIKQ